ncbi:hypothetical protein MM239_05690 [Belliella sp. DSM 111904]|uniref:DUF3352 domain-containing protein n=1 Tax=Belliella filtrata TaxID=2923435 RepID=A0ABS9UXH0_9BACT|nr:hypothetical protein [Belliella filtrata]MCH7408877.1 hypothetical protein [Belliella filtrata]
MQKIKISLISIFLVLTALAAYFLYNGTLGNRQVDALDLIAADAVFVFETHEPVLAWNQMVTQSFWQKLNEIPALKNAEEQLIGLDSLVGRSGNLDRSLKGNQLVVSLHGIGKEEFDFMFTLSFSKKSDRSFIAALETSMPELSKVTERNYSQVPIYELQNINLPRNLSYAKINNVIVASYSSFLVEEAIRHYKNSRVPNFKSSNAELINTSKKPKGLGMLRMNSLGLSKLISGMSRKEGFELVNELVSNQFAANYELKFAEGKIQFEGQSFFMHGKKMDFSEGPADFKNSAAFISNRTATLFRYNFKDIQQLGKLQNANFEFKSTFSGELEKSLISKGFKEKLTGNVLFMGLESPGLNSQDKVLLFRTQDLKSQLELLKAYSKEQQGEERASSSIDYHQGQEIFVVGMEEFPAHLFEGKYVGFEDTYVSGLGDFIVFANSSKAMKLYLDDYFSDNTWGKTLQYKEIAENFGKHSSFGMLIQVPRVWEMYLNLCTPSWRVFLERYASPLKAFESISLQVNEAGKSSLVEVKYGKVPQRAVQGVTLTENRRFSLREELIYGPKVLSNFNDSSKDFIVQDENYQLHLISGEGELVFSQVLDGPVISDVFQVDFYKNEKLQMLFATSDRLYLIDRLGNFVDGYPKEIQGKTLTHLNVVDYDNSRDYRFFVGTSQSELFLLNKQGEPLEGWDPLLINSNLAVSPAHHRVAGVGDQMIALTRGGDVHFFSRRGEPQMDSPIKLGEGFETGYLLIERGSATASRLISVTSMGEVVSVNLKGEIAYRHQLVRPDKESKFHLLKDQRNDKYLFAIHEFNKVTFIDQDFNEVFAYNLISEDVGFQYFSYSSGKQLIILTDKEQEFAYLFDEKGQMLNTLPISTKNPLSVSFSTTQNEYIIHAISGKDLVEYKLPI